MEGHVLALSFMTVAEVFQGALRAGWGDEADRTTRNADLFLPSNTLEQRPQQEVGRGTIHPQAPANIGRRCMDSSNRTGTGLPTGDA